MRPQFGSRPWTAALTRLDDTTARATARASASSRAPDTWQVISVAAPSPSAACWRARSRATASIAAPSAVVAGVRLRSSSWLPAFPDASRKTVSLVLVSPSTESWFQVRAAAGRRRPASTAGSTAASVRTTDEHRGHPRVDHPDALGDPRHRHPHGPAVGGRQLDARRRELRDRIGRPQRLGRRRQPGIGRGERRDGSRRRPSATRSSGRRVPMIPVDRWSTRSTATPAAAPTIRPISAWSASPAGPVAALAEPLVEMSLRPAVAVRADRPTSRRGSPATCLTGAAANAFGVNTAAAAAGPSVVRISTRSGRPDALIPIAAPPAAKPAGRAARRSTSGRLVGSSGIGRVAWTVVIAV